MAPLLALFNRSLRELLRSKVSYWMLVSAVGVIFIFLLGAQAGVGPSNAPGLGFFLNSLFVQLTFATLAGVSYFATAITEEKEEGTLGLLRMTNLDPLAILLGKSTSRLLGVGLLLVATLPFTLLAVTLGGISARQIFAAYLCLGAYLVLLANVAVLASVLSPRGAISTVATCALIFGTPALAALLRVVPGWIKQLPFADRTAFLAPFFEQSAGILETVNPFRRLGMLLSTGFSGPLVDGQFWWSFVLAAICLGLAWLIFDLATGDAPGWNTPRLIPLPGSRWARFAPGRAQLVSALAWKDFHFLHGGGLTQTLKWVLYSGLGAWIFGRAIVAGDPLSEPCHAVIWLMAGFLSLEMCLIGGRIVRSELRDQTLAGLTGLPYSMDHVMLMKLAGAGRSLRPALVWMLIGGGVLFIVAAVDSMSNGEMLIAFVGAAFALGYVISQVWLLAHLAAYFSLRLNWGSLPIAFAIVLAANLIGVLFFCLGFLILPIVALTYVSHLRTTIYRRLEELAAAG